MAKTGYRPDGTKVVDPFDTNEKKIAEIRKMRDGKLFVTRMDFVDALLFEYDAISLQLDGAQVLLKKGKDTTPVVVFSEERGIEVAGTEVPPASELVVEHEPLPEHHELVDHGGESGD